MKISEIIKKENKDIEVFIAEKKAKLSRLKFDLPLRKVKNTSEIKEIKKDIARALTALCQKQI
ncbi:MAG: 50S ribosomal protein L29 [Candidatus Pacebacteria bacterium]|jgi:ribosomal protein L29|nr:50S ribosomal protein L29 [Candidatus Paceibacterota bacterium]MDD3072146.1 50S ribosomal protein L29 [Candidatus Paceibacterota bacterium]MDD3728789.1 50S ribosomal protein L29 [Candidatus Paceibacterota bacterium]MDD4201352.1 50S ribosomal protein L29 [Candidatus Paceibacterota bacterium]MDD4466909.1 50S ribosomal protein L29 [Candidatus Paceibacterota bacterium]